MPIALNEIQPLRADAGNQVRVADSTLVGKPVRHHESTRRAAVVEGRHQRREAFSERARRHTRGRNPARTAPNTPNIIATHRGAQRPEGNACVALSRQMLP